MGDFIEFIRGLDSIPSSAASRARAGTTRAVARDAGTRRREKRSKAVDSIRARAGDARGSTRARRAKSAGRFEREMIWQGEIWQGRARTASAMSVSVICCFLSLRSKCAAIHIVPNGPRFARMYCE